MYRLLLLTSLFFIISPSAFGNDVEITSIEIKPDIVSRNLIPNGSFESAARDGIPSGWKWNTAGIDATCKVDTQSAFDGRRSLKFTNRSPAVAGINGELSIVKPISLEPGKKYTLSVWTKSYNPGFTRIFGGKDLEFRIVIPATKGKWRRVSLTFTPTEKDKNFEICILTRGETSGVWLDDIRLEKGDRATIGKHSSRSASRTRLTSDDQDSEIMTEGEFKVPFTVYVPKGFLGKAEVGISTSVKCLTSRVDLKPGASRIIVHGRSDSAGYLPRTITLRLLSGGKELASSPADIRFYSTPYVKSRLQYLERELPGYKAKLEQIKSRGHDIAYPLVSYTVLENSLKYTLADVEGGRIVRAVSQLSDLEQIARQLRLDLRQALAGKLIFPAVPRWTGDVRPAVRSSSFIAPTVTPGKPGVEMRPVFFNGYGHFALCQTDIEKFPDFAINIFQMEKVPMDIFRDEDNPQNPGPGLIKVLDRAQKAGVAVNLLLSPHYIPSWMFTKYPELRKKREGFIQYCTHSPRAMELLKRHIALLVEPIKDCPALHSICLSNEPRNEEEPCEYATSEWRAWLKDRHGNIGTLNSRWGTEYKSFDDVELPNPFEKSAHKPPARWADFIRWNQEFFTSWHKMLADAVHEIAPDLPVHSKVQATTMWTAPELVLGNDPYLYSSVMDISGNDGINMYTYGEQQFAEEWLSNALTYDLQRSMKDVPIYNSENHILWEFDYREVPSRHIWTALWQQAIHGQSATTLWVWETADSPDIEARPFYGCILYRPACTRAVGIVNCDLNRSAKEVASLQQAPAQVMIMHSTSSLTYDRTKYDSCLKSVYTALNFSGVKVGFITERQLEDGIMPQAPALFVPNVRYLSNAAFDALKKYKGRIVTLGDESLGYDEYGRSRHEKIVTNSVPYDRDSTLRDLWKSVWPKLSDLRPNVKVMDPSGKPVWGVEWREADTDGGTLINMVNYLNNSVNVKLYNKGENVEAVDVLTGKSLSGTIKLQPLDVRLIKVKS
jgi:hypothetical protein